MQLRRPPFEVGAAFERFWVWFWVAAAVGELVVASWKGCELVWAGPSAEDGEQPVAAVSVEPAEAGEGPDADAAGRVHPALRMAMSLPEAERCPARQAVGGRPLYQEPYI